MKAYKVIISGSYATSSDELIDYENVKGIVPFNENPDIIKKHIRNRYAISWIKTAIKKDKEYSKRDRVHRLREVYIDSLEEIEHNFSFVGKDIKEMTFEELQDLATFEDWNNIPLTKGTIREQRMLAYKEFAQKIKKTVEGNDLFSLDPLIYEINAKEVDPKDELKENLKKELMAELTAEMKDTKQNKKEAK